MKMVMVMKRRGRRKGRRREEEDILRENGSGQNPEPGLTFRRFLKHFILY